MLQMALFNVIQRHKVLSGTKARMSGSAAEFRDLDNMANEDFGAVFTALANGACL